MTKLDIQIQECRGSWLMRPLSNTFEGDGADVYFPSVPWSGLLNHHKMSIPLNLQ